MRRFLTTGIKAILAIAALSTAAHWAARVQREPAPGPDLAAARPSVPDPVTTGSIAPRRAEPAPAATAVSELDQQHLAKLISGAAEPPRAPKVLAPKVLAKR